MSQTNPMPAVLVIDMLEDFFDDGSLFDLRESLVTRINTLVHRARSVGVPVIWVRQEFRDDLKDAFPAMRKRNIRVTIAGTAGCHILPELNRHEKDIEVVKKRYSAFFGTDLESILSELGITTVILAGVNTHACIRTSAIDAYQRDFDVVIPRDCVASYDREHHDMTLRYLGRDIAVLSDLDTLELTD